uniref:ubiquitinyl hydrolase 1 n=1 Tax=Philodina roseola TaxID=96448 RepID=B6S376_PHIRO|nr:Cezanne 2 protein-like protein [Philodina roseola]
MMMSSTKTRLTMRLTLVIISIEIIRHLMLNFDEIVSRTTNKKIFFSYLIFFVFQDVDSMTYPILHRALSTVSANQTLANNQRNLLAKNFRRTSINDEIVTIDHNDADASFLLPNLFELPEEIRVRVMDSLVDTPTMASLEETKRLNWWVNKKLPCPKLYPLLTSGDGNCLLHATSLVEIDGSEYRCLSLNESELDNPRCIFFLYFVRFRITRSFDDIPMWGFHDHSLSMRKALNETLITSKPNNALYRRWRWTQSVQNKKVKFHFRLFLSFDSFRLVRTGFFRTRMERRMEKFTSFVFS